MCDGGGGGAAAAAAATESSLYDDNIGGVGGSSRMRALRLRYDIFVRFLLHIQIHPLFA